MNGVMEELMKENGSKTICMVKGLINGRMEDHMQVDIKKIKNMDLEFILGQIKEDMKGNGLKENSMGKDNMYFQMDQ